jgi:hypothetical protein
MPLTSVPNQVPAGTIDGFLRDDAGDGTLGLPDYSLVPYTYAPMVGPTDSAPQWVIDQYRYSRFAAFKGGADGYGALRSVGGTRGSLAVTVIPQASGTKSASPDGSRDADYTWGPRDFVVPVRHPGATTWSASSVRAYLAFTQSTNSVGMRLTTSAALGPWDAELADSAAVSLAGLVNVWDGNPHTITVSAFGQNIFCLIDGALGIPFRAPRAYKRNDNGTTDTTVFSNLPSSGSYAGFDCRGIENFLYQWDALQPASGDFFSYDMGPTAVQVPPSATSTPTTLPSGETWAVTGTATASKDGLLLAASATASFTLDHPYGYLSTRWGPATAEGGMVWRRQDATNYYLVTSTGVLYCAGGTLFRFHTFTRPLVSGDHVVVQNRADTIRVYVNGVSVAYYFADFFKTAKSVGFLSPAAGTSQFRYIAFQPMVSDPILPTA